MRPIPAELWARSWEERREPGGPDQLRLEDIEAPKPGWGQVLVQLKSAALNRRDILVRTREQYRAPMPFTPGSDGAGVIAEVGPGLGHVRAGDEVVIYPAWRALITKARVQPGEAALIHGAGSGVTSFAVQIAKLAGARVIVTWQALPQTTRRVRHDHGQPPGIYPDAARGGDRPDSARR